MDEAGMVGGAVERIPKVRRSRIVVTARDSSGKPLAGCRIRLVQETHEFLLGCNAFALFSGEEGRQERYQSAFSALFNYATLPFYWGSYEKERGVKRVADLERMARWCRERCIAVKGHPLVWHEVWPKWGPMDADGARSMSEARVRELVSWFAGLVDRWDVVNEATVSERFENGVGAWAKRDGSAAMVGECLSWARQAGPRACLLYNDYNISPEFESLVGALKGQGSPFDAIGIQSHMHQGEWTLEKAWTVCETYARFGLPLHFTELTVLSGEHGWLKAAPWPTTPEGEGSQAEYVEKLYTVLFSHPAVAAVTWWDMGDGSWQGAPAGLVRADLSPKPAYERLRDLFLRRWRTAVEVETGADGSVSVDAYRGTYSVSAATPAGLAAGRFRLGAAGATVEVVPGCVRTDPPPGVLA